MTALLVLLAHIVWEVFPNGHIHGLPAPLALLLHPLEFSNKVAIFIVISGYCIALPLIRRRSLQMPDGAAGFLKRRARRILPAYYAALTLFLAVIALTPSLGKPTGARWDVALPAWNLPVILSHLLLVHNLDPQWNVAIDPPMWSLAIEWQMYVVFLLVLLPIWRRFGLIPAILVGSMAGYAPHFLLPAGRNFDWTTPWYVCLFCLGMGAAATWHEPRGVYRISLCGTAFFGAGAFGFFLLGADWCSAYRPLVDLWVGLLTACFLAHAASATHLSRPPIIVKRLGATVPVWLGTISYILYLIHFPILSWLHHEFRKPLQGRPENPTVMVGLLFLIAVPLCITAAYGLHRLMECSGKAQAGYCAFVRDNRKRARRAA